MSSAVRPLVRDPGPLADYAIILMMIFLLKIIQGVDVQFGTSTAFRVISAFTLPVLAIWWAVIRYRAQEHYLATICTVAAATALIALTASTGSFLAVTLHTAAIAGTVAALYSQHCSGQHRPLSPLRAISLVLVAIPGMYLAGISHTLLTTGQWPPMVTHDRLPEIGYALAPFLVRAIYSGVVEEAAGALLIIALEQRRVPVWAIYLIGATVRASYHIYMGASCYSAALMTLPMIFLYRRYRRVVPLAAAHAIYDIGTILWAPSIAAAAIISSYVIIGLAADKVLRS